MKKKAIKSKSVLSLYIENETKEKLNRKAKQNRRSLSGQAVRILESNLDIN